MFVLPRDLHGARRIRVEHRLSGVKLIRFAPSNASPTGAAAFIILALSGLNISLGGRVLILPLFGAACRRDMAGIRPAGP